MADIEITGLDAATQVQAGDLFHLKQGTVDKRLDESILKRDMVNSNVYVQSGTAAAYVLAITGDTVAPAAYFNGMVVYFKVVDQNTGALTVNVAGLGIRSVVDASGTALTGEELQQNVWVTLVFDSSNNRFEFVPGPLNLADASTTTRGLTQLSDTSGGSSTSLAATENLANSKLSKSIAETINARHTFAQGLSLDNNQFLSGENTLGDATNILGVSSTNVCSFGASGLVSRIDNNGTCNLTSHDGGNTRNLHGTISWAEGHVQANGSMLSGFGFVSSKAPGVGDYLLTPTGLSLSNLVNDFSAHVSPVSSVAISYSLEFVNSGGSPFCRVRFFNSSGSPVDTNFYIKFTRFSVV